MKNVESKTRMRLTDEHLNECMPVAETGIKCYWDITRSKAVIRVILLKTPSPAVRAAVA
jgi:hypothetical protein